MVHKAKTIPFMSEAGKQVSQDQVLEEINKAKQFLDANKDVLGERVYDAMDGFSRTALQFLNAKGAQGWAAATKDATGNALWAGTEAEAVEAALPAAIVQAGGGPQIPGIRLGEGSSLITKPLPTDISLDQAYYAARDYLAAIDEKNREIAATIGPVAFINGMEQDPRLGPFPPYLPVPLIFPSRLILPMLNTILETCRILVSVFPFRSDLLRQIMSIVLAILDVSRGQWRDGVLSLFGLFSTNMMLVGMVGKTARWVYNFISPDLQDQLEDDLYKSTKSMFVGFWLWLLSVAAPDFVRNQINALMLTANQAIQAAQDKIVPIQQKAIASGQQMGLKVSFPKFPLEKLPSLDDIQNFQSLLHRPEILCSAEFQAVLQPALAIPPVRLFLELLNFPTQEQDKAKLCAGRPASVGEALVQSLTPVVTQEKVGGTRRKRQRSVSRIRRHKNRRG
jgi:hypothetical protein